MCAFWFATLKGLPEAVNTVWDRVIIQTCVIHLLRDTFRYASRKYWDQIAKDIRPVYTAPTETAPRDASLNSPRNGCPVPGNHPALGERLERVRAVPELRRRIRRVICSTNAVESINARYRRAIRAPGTSRPNRLPSSVSTS
jgi:transposase-like protein